MTLSPREFVEAPAREWRSHSEYQESGVDWIGRVPTAWCTKPLKDIITFVSRGNSPDYVEYSSIPVINQACIRWDGLHLENVKYQKDTDVNGWKGLLRKGDLAMNSTGTGTLGRVAACDINGPYLADSHVTIIRVVPKSYSAGYLLYLISTPLYQGYIYSALVSGSTNQIELSREGLRSTPLISPPLDEQRAIAAFLDRETQKIDDLVARRERLIGLLEEKRTALISRAVTKGLDPDVPMKDSGVEWIGLVPKHWRVMKVKRLCQVRRGASPRPIDDQVYFDEDGEYAWVRISDVTASRKYLRTTKQRLSLLGQSKSVALEPGELFVSIAGSVGKPIITSIKCCIHDGFVYFVRLLQNREYLYYVFSGGEVYKGLGKLGTQLNLNTETIGGIKVPVPPENEQREIVALIESKSSKIDALVRKIHEHIDKLREYRTALISAAVTGKIDVREEEAT